MSTHFRVAFLRRIARVVSAGCIVLLMALPFATLAQAAPASASSTIITVPPRPLTSVPPGQDDASDSTLYSTGIPAPVPSSIQIALPSGGGTTPPPTTCTAGTSAPASNCTALTCPSGYAGTPAYTCACNSTGNGYVSTPTQTQVNSAPTSYGCTALACTAGASEPTADCLALVCPSGYNGTPSYTCACNSAGTGYVSTPTQTQVNSTPTSYGCTAQACTPGASEPTSDCPALTCPSGYNGTPSYTCACNGTGTGYVSTPTQTQVTSSPTSYGCTAQVCPPNTTSSCNLSCSGFTYTGGGTETCNSTGTAWGTCSGTCPGVCLCKPPSPACSGPASAVSKMCGLSPGFYPSTTACTDYGVAGQSCPYASWTCGGSSPYGTGDTCAF